MITPEDMMKKIEKAFFQRNKREKTDFPLNGEVWEVLLLTRQEKADLIYSIKSDTTSSFKSVLEWLKPSIYKAFQLKEAAIKAKSEGYITTYYDVIERLFDPDELVEIVHFMLSKNNIHPISIRKELIETK